MQDFIAVSKGSGNLIRETIDFPEMNGSEIIDV
jgi:hypothetical protein